MALKKEVEALKAAGGAAGDAAALTTRVETLEGAATASATAASTLTDRVTAAESAATTLTDDFEDRAIVKAGWMKTERQKDDDADGVVTLAEFCLEGPAVAEVSAFISVIPTDPRI